MHKILIYTSNKKNKIRESLEYSDMSEFIVQFTVFRKAFPDDIDFILDEDIITFEELEAFFSILFEKPFQNEDNCKTKEELIEWMKAFQFMCMLDEEISWFLFLVLIIFSFYYNK